MPDKDHAIRPGFRIPGNKPFPWSKLPVELALKIIAYAVSISQGTYRALLLTDKTFSDCIRLEMLPRVPIMLTTKKQMDAFDAYLQKRPEVVPHIHALWTIVLGSIYPMKSVCAAIIRRCTSLRSLACHPAVLHEALQQDAPLAHTHCTDLTLFQFTIWNAPQANIQFAHLLNQVRRLHLIGSLESSPFASHVLPKLASLQRISVATGTTLTLDAVAFGELLQSPNLEQVVVTTSLHGDKQQDLKLQAPEIDHRIAVLHRRRRWKEHNLWRDSLQDPDCFWKQAEKEKDLPPAPRS